MSIKNKIIFYIAIFFFMSLFWNFKSFAEELDITASEIIIDSDTQVVFAKGSVIIIDSEGNKIETERAKYDKSIDQVTTYENSKIILKNGYIIKTSEILYDNKNRLITSDTKSTLVDLDGNFVSTEMFEYLIEKNLFSSKGKIKIKDINKNTYFFKEMYIDTLNKKIVGSDIRVKFDEENFGLENDNDPRFVANSGLISKEKSNFRNGVFTTCKLRGEKCPPWTLQAKSISHDKAKKTIYYESAVLKIYDIPIFYFPKFFHPDPTVKKQSGFLIPFVTDKSTIGTGFALPYYWAMSHDKDFTITPKFYSSHRNLYLMEYRQVFENANLILDTSYTEGYRDTTPIKSAGSRNHIFGRFNLDLAKGLSYESRLSLDFQKVSNDTFFRLHDLNTALVDSSVTDLKSEINYGLIKDDMSLNIRTQVYENLLITSRKRYEYFLPTIDFEKNLFASKKFGNLDYKSKAYYHNYDVDKTNKFFINDLIWNSKNFLTKFGLINSLETQIKNTNYNSENDSDFKIEKDNHEISGVLALKTRMPMQKESKKHVQTLSPNFMFRFAPGHMRNIQDASETLSYANLFSTNKTNKNDVIEKGTSVILGFDWILDEKKEFGYNEKLSVSMGQVFSIEKNKSIPNATSLDQRMSDLVGEIKYNFLEDNTIDYKFSLDHNYKDLNYNEISSNFSFGIVDFNLDYLEERKHIGNENYISTGITLNINESSSFSFETRKNFKTESTEYYNFNYQYINDCLTAGIVFNRNFYSDRDLEPSDTLMFKISLIPFGGVVSPSIYRD